MEQIDRIMKNLRCSREDAEAILADIRNRHATFEKGVDELYLCTLFHWSNYSVYIRNTSHTSTNAILQSVHPITLPVSGCLRHIPAFLSLTYIVRVVQSPMS